MYKVLIVDDEKWIRKGIVHKLQQINVPYEWVKEAADGSMAMDIIQEECPDIIITDVKMDDVDGISLIRLVREAGLDVRFMIISGHAEFEYAEQALNMGVMGYLLKPIKEEQFRSIFANLCEDVKKGKERQQSEAKREIQMKKTKQLIEEQVLNHALSQNKTKSEEYFPSDLLAEWEHTAAPLPEYFQLFDRPNMQYTLVIVHIDRTNYSGERFKYQDLGLMKFAIKNISETLLMDRQFLIGNNLKDQNQVHILLQFAQKDGHTAQIEQFIFRLFTTVTKLLKITVTIGISSTLPQVSEELYKQARAALDLRFIKGNHNVFYAKDVSMSSRIDIPIEQLSLLSKAIELSDFKNVEVILLELLSNKKLKDASLLDFRLIYMEIIRTLMRLCSQQQLELPDSIDFDFMNMDLVQHFDRTEDLVQYLLTTIVTLVKPEHRLPMDCSAIVQNIRGYMQANYADNLTVKELSRKFAINSNYLSTLYKAEAGITFVKELTGIRMEKAQQLLQLTGMSIAQIALSVGFEDVHYFHRKFKQMYGITPLEYRNQAAK
ncbi:MULTISPECIES: response regulator transcription factor [unclassified Paenibacillus]|uniref:response regulator transcription factor n=1 Tax=unclassified Paenibacillus TaxID=185978 RepID=UPI002F40A749